MSSNTRENNNGRPSEERRAAISVVKGGKARPATNAGSGREQGKYAADAQALADVWDPHKRAERQAREEKEAEQAASRAALKNIPQVDLTTSAHAKAQAESSVEKPEQQRSTQQRSTQQGPAQQRPEQQKPTQQRPEQQRLVQRKPLQQRLAQQNSEQQRPTQQNPAQQNPTQQSPAQRPQAEVKGPSSAQSATNAHVAQAQESAPEAQRRSSGAQVATAAMAAGAAAGAAAGGAAGSVAHANGPDRAVVDVKPSNTPQDPQAASSMVTGEERVDGRPDTPEGAEEQMAPEQPLPDEEKSPTKRKSVKNARKVAQTPDAEGQVEGEVDAAFDGTEPAADGDGEASAYANPRARTERGARENSRPQQRVNNHLGRKIVLAIIIVAVLVVAGIGGYAALSRWCLADDATALQGVWHQSGEKASITITADTINLADEVTYQYTLDTQAKVINESLGKMEGTARYRFSQDGNSVAIFDDGSTDWWANAMTDLSWYKDCLVAQITGSTPPDLLGGESGVILYRSGYGVVTAANTSSTSNANMTSDASSAASENAANAESASSAEDEAATAADADSATTASATAERAADGGLGAAGAAGADSATTTANAVS